MKKYATRKNPGKPPKKAGKDGGNKSKLIIIASVVSTLGYFFLSSAPEAPEMKATAPAKVQPQKVAAPKVVELVDTKAPEPPPTINLQQLRSTGLGNIQFNFQDIELKQENGSVKIPFSFRSQAVWCTGGDLDLFKLLTRDKNEDEFLVTLETLTSKVRGDRAPVSYNKLLAGFDKTFQIDVRKSSESLGLFICMDKEGKKSCRGKELQTYKAIYDAIADKETRNEAYGKDYILYYQNFILKDGRLSTYDNQNISKQSMTALESHIKNNYGINPLDTAASSRFANVTRSLAAKIENNKIVLTLPYNDPRCAPGSSIP